MSIGKHTFWELINDSEFGKIQIPKIQRDYVQGRNTPQVQFAREKLLSELSEVLKNEQKAIDLNYVYGKTELDCFIPIDGQQRLTTLLLLHIYAFAKEGLYDYLKKLKPKFIYETRVTTERFLEEIIDHLPSFFEENSNYNSITSFVCDAPWFSDNWLSDPSVDSCLTVLDDIHKLFTNINDISSKLISEKCPITFMALQMSNMGKANDLYIKMNSRGKPLSDFESFKSELFNYIDEMKTDNWPTFKNKIDNEWLSMIWDGCTEIGQEASKTCDNNFMHLMHWIVLNYVVPSQKSYENTDIQNLINNRGFFNFANYKIFLANGIAITDICKTFGFLEFLQAEDQETHKSLLSFLLNMADRPDWPERVLLFAITKYAKTAVVWDVDAFNSWYRIIRNLVANTAIDREDRFIAACQSIDGFGADAFTDFELYLAYQVDRIPFFDRQQLSEEIYKCKLIKKDIAWKDAIIHAENHKYFNGEIAFALKLAGAKVEDSSSASTINIGEFNSVWHNIEMLFNADGLNVNESLFRRALLTYGNYSIWANSSCTFFFESGKGYFNWRRMLREDRSFKIFKNLFCEIQQCANDSKEIENVLSARINEFDDKTDEFLYYLVKFPELLDYMNEKRFYICSGDKYKNRIILYSRARLSAEYAEMHTYAVKVILGEATEYQFGRGYLDANTSWAHINKVYGKECYISYDGKFVDENGSPLIGKDGIEIKTIDDAVNYVRNFIES